MATSLELRSPLAPPLPLRRFSVEQYHLLGELGVLTAEDHVELLEGWIVEKMNQRPIHGFVVAFLTELFQSRLPDGFSVRCQLPITAERSEPEPDIAIIRGSHTAFRERHPGGCDCRLIIEVADSSLEKDRSKAQIYFDAGVAEYWIVNVAEKHVEQYVFADSSAKLHSIIVPGDSPISILCDEVECVLDLKQIFDQA